MTRSENIMSRWSRMKQQSARRAAPEDLSSDSKPIDAEAGDLNRATAAAPATDSPASPAFDPASLPPLHSITAGTDIRSFLGSNVPLDLTKAALRRAWVTDPAIRDRLEIATAIPARAFAILAAKPATWAPPTRHLSCPGNRD